MTTDIIYIILTIVQNVTVFMTIDSIIAINW